MKLSTKSRYAVMALADLALEGGEHAVLLRDIAKRQKISGTYLEQIFMHMRRAGLVTGTRGPGGGYRLARRPSDIRIADIITAVDEPVVIMGCKLHSSQSCTGSQGKCLAHHFLADLDKHIHAFLDQFSLDQLIRKHVPTHKTTPERGYCSRSMGV